MSDPTAELALEIEIAEYLAAHGWLYSPNDTGYDAELALFPEDVFGWLEETQPTELAKVVTTGSPSEAKQRRQLLTALAKRLDAPMSHGGGTLNVLRRPFSHVNAHFSMCQFRPATTMNPTTTAAYRAVRLRVLRQVRFSPVKGDHRAIDLVFFVNGIPVATAELKTFFKQRVTSAIDQYKHDRDPRSAGVAQPLLGHGNRALVHFAVDDDEVWMTTRLAGARTHFLPFNRGTADGGAGNPPNPAGPASSYLWERVLEREAWLKILGALMFVKHAETADPISGKKTKTSTILFPRFHQWEVVTDLLAAARADGPGARYLVQHSAGSGKTNSIAWAAHRLARLHNDANEKVFDTVLVITDRTVLDDQLQAAVRQIDDRKDLVVTIDETEVRRAGGSKSKALARALLDKRLIVVVTIQTFHFLLQELAENAALRAHNFAIIVDEAHTSQTGATASEVRAVLSAGGVAVPEGAEIDGEDLLNAAIEQQIKAAMTQRAAPANLSYFAFTATPKAKTLELFGRPDAGGIPRAFHLYSMKQAIEEGFILDVLRGYQNYSTAYEIERAVGAGIDAGAGYADADGDLVDEKATARAIMTYLRLHPANIGQKVRIVVDHFRANVAGLLDGHAKAMVVTSSRKAAVRYKVEIDAYLRTMGYDDMQALVAFSGSLDDPDYNVQNATEVSMNPGIASRDLAAEFKAPEYRVMIVADKFQTGFDQPLLCAMYVDKRLDGITAVQTLSRLNRVYRAPSGEVKDRTFILDFVNEPLDIQASFEPYFAEARIETTTDPNIVHEIAAKLAEADIYTADDVEAFARARFARAGHGALSAAIKGPKDAFAARYNSAKVRKDTAELEGLELFRKDAGTFVRLYDFMSQVIDYENTSLERLSVFLRHLVRVIAVDRLGTEVDLSDVVLKRVKQVDRGTVDLALSGEAALTPATGAGSGAASRDPRLIALDEIIARINSLFAGAFELGTVEGFVRSAATEVSKDPQVVAEIEANEIDQFRKSPTLENKVIDAVLDVPGLMTRMTTEAIGSPDIIAAIAEAAYLLHTMRQADGEGDGPRRA